MSGMMVVQRPVGETSGICCSGHGRRSVVGWRAGGCTGRLMRPPEQGGCTYLNQCSEEEKEVRVAAKLLKEELWNKCCQRVLCRAGHVWTGTGRAGCEQVQQVRPQSPPWQAAGAPT